MTSDAVIVTPSQLRTFSQSLHDSMQRLAGANRQMRDSAAAARAVWKDAKYDTFRANLDRCADEIEKFGRTGARYAEFLEEKARLASKYLHNR